MYSRQTKHQRIVVCYAILLIAISAVLAACNPRNAELDASEVSVDASQGETAPIDVLKAAEPGSALFLVGQDLYGTHCAQCHDEGLGKAPLTSTLQKLSPDYILQSMIDGAMVPQSAHLSVDEKTQISQYVGNANTTTITQLTYCDADIQQASELDPVHTPDWGLGYSSERWVSDTPISADTVSALRLDWVFAIPAAIRARSQPTVAGNVIFMGGQNAKIYAIDLGTGCLLWDASVGAEIRNAVAIESNAEGEATHLYFGDFEGYAYGFDIATRKVIWKRKADPHPRATITGSVRFHEGTVYVPVSSLEVISAADPSYACCSFRGSVLALDARSGAVKWQSFTTDPPEAQGKTAAGVIRYGPSGAPIWSSPTIDSERGVLYVGTGQNYSRPATLTSDSILALSLETGDIMWSSQVTENDVWNGACGRDNDANCPQGNGPDFDFGAPPILTRTPTGKDIVLAGQKSGKVYAFDPDDSGHMLWDMQVGRGGIMGGIHWGMATDQKKLYVPVSDTSVYDRDAHKPSQAGLHSLDMDTGAILWRELTDNVCGDAKWRCDPGLSSAITGAPGIVFAGGLDGMLRAFSADTGQVLWEFNALRSFGQANGISAEGGSFDSDGPVIIGDRLLVTSGYDLWGLQSGNVLLAFRLDPDRFSKSP